MKTFFVSLILILCLPFQAHADVKDLKLFKNIPVLDNGRVKPIDTYARSLLTQFSGKDHYKDIKASQWLASLFFDPQTTINEDIFQINNPDTAASLGIPADPHRRYSPAQIQKVYKKLYTLQEAARKIDEKERSLVEAELIRVFENINTYAELSRSFSFTFPHTDFTITSMQTKRELSLPINQDQFSFIDIALKAQGLSVMTQNLEHKTPSQYSSDEREILHVTNNLFQWSQIYQGQPILLIPSSKPEEWLSPWVALGAEFKNEKTRLLLSHWNDMATHYRQGNGVEFNVAAHLYLNEIRPVLSKADLKNYKKFPLEVFYHSASPFTTAIVFYILTFLLFIVSFGSSKPLWYRLAVLSTFAGFAIHVVGLGMRIIIMARPPVSNLYETFIFVAFIAVLLGLIIEHFNRSWLGLITAAISGTALLFIANKYSAEGDTLKMLVAVLNSNFWLATHVTTITMGYGATCVGGVLGHIWLIQACFKKDLKTLETTHRTILGILGVALTLTFLGTNLGGIWADQSWGRFWGWDPKENGALMIVLWTALLFHAKVARMIGALGLAMGAVIGMIVVMWAWFGVNLLSVGLHSYGFTTGIATTLIAYVVLEILFMVITYWFICKK